MAGQVFPVKVTVLAISDPHDSVAFHINVNPERVPLDGNLQNTIQWTIAGATFKDVSDIEFMSNAGKERFQVTLDSPTQITARLSDAIIEDEIIYGYLLRVHIAMQTPLGEVDVTIRLDPEVDNPPPPPGGP
jgi:hypothetical protein